MEKKSVDYSLILLLGINAVIIFLSIVQSWDFSLLIWIYFFQSISIGIFSFIKILNLKNYSTEGFKINEKSVSPTKKIKTYTAFFFLFHYGFFHLGYTLFLFTGFGFPLEKIKTIIFASLIFAINHGFSYFYNKENDSKIKENIGNVMFKPYKRIFPMHLIIIFGSLVSSAMLTPLFVVLKTFFDGFMHKKEHSPNKNLKLYFKTQNSLQSTPKSIKSISKKVL